MNKTFEELEQRVADLDATLTSLARDVVTQTRRIDNLRDETPDVLTLGSIRGEVRDLRKQLFGDTEMKAAYEKAKATGTWPAMPGPKLEDPPPGLFESIQAQLESLGRLVSSYQTALDGKMTFVRKLEAFFGPLIAVNNGAPLDGQQISTKAFVDEGVSRIARTIRAEVEEKFVARAAKLSVAYDVAKALIDVLGEMPKNRENAANADAREVARKIYQMWRREEDLQTVEKNQGSRFESLVHAITGRGGRKS